MTSKNLPFPNIILKEAFVDFKKHFKAIFLFSAFVGVLYAITFLLNIPFILIQVASLFLFVFFIAFDYLLAGKSGQVTWTESLKKGFKQLPGSMILAMLSSLWPYLRFYGLLLLTLIPSIIAISILGALFLKENELIVGILMIVVGFVSICFSAYHGFKLLLGYTVSGYIYVLENLSLRDSLKRSRELIKGSYKRMFIHYLVISAPIFMFMSLFYIYMIYMMVTNIESLEDNPLYMYELFESSGMQIAMVVTSFIFVMFLGFISAYGYHLYKHLIVAHGTAGEEYKNYPLFRLKHFVIFAIYVVIVALSSLLFYPLSQEDFKEKLQESYQDQQLQLADIDEVEIDSKEQAQASLDEFKTVLENPEESFSSFAVYGYVGEEDSKEAVWIYDVSYDETDQSFTGVLDYISLDSELELGTELTIKQDDVIDWFYFDKDTKVGGNFELLMKEAFGDEFVSYERQAGFPYDSAKQFSRTIYQKIGEASVDWLSGSTYVYGQLANQELVLFEITDEGVIESVNNDYEESALDNALAIAYIYPTEEELEDGSTLYSLLAEITMDGDDFYFVYDYPYELSETGDLELIEPEPLWLGSDFYGNEEESVTEEL